MSFLLNSPGFSSGGSPPAGSPGQFIMVGPDGQPLYVNESAAANLEYLTPAGYVNEAS